MNTLGLLQSNSGFTLTLQETQSNHDSMNIVKIEFIAYIYSHIETDLPGLNQSLVVDKVSLQCLQ